MEFQNLVAPLRLFPEEGQGQEVTSKSKTATTTTSSTLRKTYSDDWILLTAYQV
jgi:hypothetical protein